MTREKTTEVRQVVCVRVFLVLAVLAVFGQTAHFEFVNYDDDENVFANPVVKKGLSAQAVGWAFTHAQVSNWVPLTTLSHILDCQFFGLGAGGHHLVNVLWHAANAVLLFLVLRQMTGSIWRSGFVAALFAVHPLRAESVAWVSERKDVLSGFFFILTIGAYVRYARKPSRAGYIAVVLLFAFGLFAKSMVATLPLVLLLLDYWPLGRWHNWRQLPGLVREKIPLLALSAGACVVAALVPGLVVTGAHRLSLLERLANVPVSYAVYLRQTVFPAGLAALYPNAPNVPSAGTVCLALVLLAVISAGVVVWRKKRPCLLVGWLWYLGMLLPVIGIIQISQYAAHADRYTYLPGIGLALAGTWAVADWSAGWRHRRLVLSGLIMAVIGALTICAHHQTSYWRDSRTLWTRTLACTPANPVAHYNLGVILLEKGDGEGAAAEFRRAVEIKPDYVFALNDLGATLAAKGANVEAIAQYRQALKLDPNYAIARYNLGHALAAEGQLDEAIAQCRKALEIKPDYANAHFGLGTALLAKQQWGEAVTQLRRALEINPDLPQARYDLGAALVKIGQLDEAVVQYRKALALQPDDVKARLSLGKALLRKGDFDGAMACFPKAAALSAEALIRWQSLGEAFLQNKDFDVAIVCYRQAIKINPRCTEAYANLGLAFIRNGQAKEAIDSWKQALEIDPNQLNVQKDAAWVLATTPEGSVRNGAKAVALAEAANHLSGGSNPIILRTLAAAYAETGRFGDATATARRALELAAVQKNPQLAAGLEEEIKLYEAGTPMRAAAR